MVEIIKSALDDRQYRSLVLDNDLEVLLVHDPTTDTGAAALSVRVGSYEDPDDLPGLAHFLEHLLFMGTEKYPEESEYGKFLNAHAGKSNAYTAAEHTNYHFDVAWPHLREALDRFAQFFIAPLFAENTKNREILAVDSENKRNLQSDVWRFFQLKKNLSNPNHPISKFSTGNYDTLGRTPEAQGIDVRARLIEFYKQHYTSGIMKLVVIGRQSLDVLESYVQECFTAVPNTHPDFKNQPPFYRDILPLRPQDLGTVIFAKPVMNLHMLTLTFPIPDQQSLADTSPYFYYLDLLGHESEGSLLYFLKQKRWATEVSAVISHICTGSDHLYLNIELTNSGLEEWKSVISAVFGYISMVVESGVQSWFFDEQRTISAASFEFRQKSRSMPLASALAEVLHRPIPRERVLNYMVPQRFDHDQISDFARYLVPANTQVLLASPLLEGLDSREQWYGTEYRVEPLNKITPMFKSSFHLPHSNEFLTTNFQLEVPPESSAEVKVPQLLINRPNLRLWHKLNVEFRVPKAHIFVKLINGGNNKSAYEMRCAELFVALINDLLNDYAYYADLADVSMVLAASSDGLEIEVYGFSEKLDTLLKLVMETVMEGDLAKLRFQVVKEQQHRDLENLALAQADAQRTIQTSYLLLEKVYPLEERLAALHKIEFEDIINFATEFRENRRGAEILVLGNKTSVQARAAAEIVESCLSKNTNSELAHANSVHRTRNTSYLYPDGTDHYREVKLVDPENVNSALFVGFQFGEEQLELSAKLSIVSQILKEATFDQLRTKEQLGYVVMSTKSQARSTLWLNFFVQSEESTQFVESRIENYIDNVAAPLIAGLTEEQYAKHLSALTAELLEAPKNLTEESFRFWGTISSGFYDFGRRQKLAAAVNKVDKDDIISIFDKCVKSKETRTRLALHLKSQRHRKPDPETVLARSVGQLVTEREIPVTVAEIQRFSIECRGLEPQEALSKLGQILVTQKNLPPADAQHLIMEILARSQMMINQNGIDTSKPLGEDIKTLQDLYEVVTLAARPEPVEPWRSYTKL